jgi:lactate dehydrogenase-like 2-hydroxyacid dehydrogenase
MTNPQGSIYELNRLGVKLIAPWCAGFNNVDLPSASANNIKAVRCLLTHAVAEHAVTVLTPIEKHIRFITGEENFSLKDQLVLTC